MKHSNRKKKKSGKHSKKAVIIIISIILAICLALGGGFVFWKMYQREPTTRDSHIQVATQTVEKDEKILIRTEAGQDPVYINAIEGMPKNSYDDNSFYTDDYGFKAYSHNGKKISSVGIDVSYIQGDIDWESVTVFCTRTKPLRKMHRRHLMQVLTLAFTSLVRQLPLRRLWKRQNIPLSLSRTTT